MTPILQAIGLATVVIGTGAATVTVLNDDIPDMPIPAAEWAPSGALDGRSFAITADLSASDAPETDVLRFDGGRFHSVDCERYCAFGWTDYQTWEAGETIHFTATTRCPTAPHTVVWHGQVTGDEIAVEMSWTTRRWYWTHQITGVGHGTATDHVGPSQAPTG
jgi:hypothetical protein